MIPVSKPALVGNEMKYVQDCVESTWISSMGTYIGRFEQRFADFCGAANAVGCCNGTAALHLALLALGVGRGDEVLVPSLTYVATANAVTYCGAKPVFVDSELGTWNMDVKTIESLVTDRTKGVIVVHLFGHPVDMDPINEIARDRGLFVVEDAAEAHGAEYKGKRVGVLGNVAAFSFYGNKIISTGEGGMLVTNNKELADRIKLLKGQGMDPDRRYWFPILGYNYRMTNLAAAIGLAQMERIDWHLEERRRIALKYRENLSGYDQFSFQAERQWAKHAHWLPGIVLNDDCKFSRDEVMAKLLDAGIETRPFFVPLHRLPIYTGSAQRSCCSVADRLAQSGISLPSYAGLDNADVNYVCDVLKGAVG